MQETGSIRLFKRGPAAELRLFILIVAAIGFMVVDSRWQALEPVREAVSVAIYPFQRLMLAPRDLYEHFDSWNNAAARVRSEKEALQRQRIELAQLATHAAQLETENEQLRRLLNVSDTVTQQAIAVQVLYEPSSAFSQHLVFNKGSHSGIEPGMPVIDEGGVVGQVVRVTPYTSEAALLTDDKVSIPVQVLRNGLRLIAFGGHAGGKIEIRYLNETVDIEPGDTLVTSGIGGLFPAGLPVARIETVEHDTTSGFAHALANPLSHPERYRHFLVLRIEDVTEESRSLKQSNEQ